MADFLYNSKVRCTKLLEIWKDISSYFRFEMKLIRKIELNYSGHLSLTISYFYVQQWKLHIFELEKEMKVDPSIKYVIYQVLRFYLPLRYFSDICTPNNLV